MFTLTLRSSIRITILVAATLFAAAVPARAELLINGDLENYAFGNPVGWSYGGGQPGSGQASPNSPFNGVYPAGTSSLLSLDGPAVDLSPSLSQSFTPQTSIGFSFDFLMANITGSQWYYVIEGGTPSFGNVTAFVFEIDTFNHSLVADGLGAAATILTIDPNTWYHVEGNADTSTHLFGGSVTPFGSSPIPFTNVGFNALTTNLNRVDIEDSFSAGPGNTYQNGDLYTDNFSITPEPTSLALLTIGAFPFFARRRRLKNV